MIIFDLLVIGAGVNGAGIARDAVGNGLKVLLCDAGDIGGATSASSTKLIHGGLRYLEFYEFGLVRKALAEREVILRIAPHIAWPLGFVLPHVSQLRPTWMIRLGLFLYDHLARRHEVPGSHGIDLRRDPAGACLADTYRKGFRYFDGWIEDNRLTVINAMDAAARGARVMTRTAVAKASVVDGLWHGLLSMRLAPGQIRWPSRCLGSTMFRRCGWSKAVISLCRASTPPMTPIFCSKAMVVSSSSSLMKTVIRSSAPRKKPMQVIRARRTSVMPKRSICLMLPMFF
jgi:hypothetical protein